MKNFNQAIQRYYETRGEGKNDSTYANYFNKQFGNKNVNDIGKEDIANARSNINKSPGTINRYMNFLRAVLNYCYEDLGWLDARPVIKRVKEPSKRIKFFTLEDCARLHEALPEHLKPIFILSLVTGIRMSTAKLEVGEDVKDGWIAIHADETKNGKSYIHTFKSRSKKTIRQY